MIRRQAHVHDVEVVQDELELVSASPLSDGGLEAVETLPGGCVSRWMADLLTFACSHMGPRGPMGPGPLAPRARAQGPRGPLA